MTGQDPFEFARQFLSADRFAQLYEVQRAAVAAGIEVDPIHYGRAKALVLGWVKAHESAGGFPAALLAEWSGAWGLIPPLHTLESLAAEAGPMVRGLGPGWENIVLSARECVILANDENIVERDITARLTASDDEGFRAGELLLGVHNAVAEDTILEPEVPRFGRLTYVSERDDVPTYELHCES